jgi:hypothetical protein
MRCKHGVPFRARARYRIAQNALGTAPFIGGKGAERLAEG